MKKLSVFISALFIFFLSTGAIAQTQTGADYFAGKWNMLVKGLPNGDTKMFVVLDKKDTTMTGVIQDSVGTEISKFSKVELKENEVTVYFTAQGYDVYMLMTKKDDDHVTGSMMGMFDAEGIRTKADK
ncbi:MAG TPA: hypothetical protein VGZ90_18085 [Puia sp.]|jgi:hypothetical protein|nr:hypothetical protein [Puia sp.]